MHIKQKTTPTPKIILYWTLFYGAYEDLRVEFGQKPFADCKVNNCIATNDRQLLNRSDALIFHACDYNQSDLPAIRLQHQRYIFYLFESNANSDRNLPVFVNTSTFFNWTMTHRRNSDIFASYFYGSLSRKSNFDIL